MSEEGQVPATEAPLSNKEFNFRQLEAKHAREIAELKAQNEKYAREMEALRTRSPIEEEEDTDPYVDNRKLRKTLDKFGQSTKGEIQAAMEAAKQKAKEELKQEIWLDSNPDFYDVMQKHAQNFLEKAPQLAESILHMPDGFARQKLVYQNIKALGIDRPEPPKQSIQDKVDANRRNLYYVPPTQGAPPYAMAGDFSQSGQKSAYEKMKQAQTNLRLG